MPDAHKNFAYSTVATAPSPADTGTSLVVQTGNGTKFPTPPFNVTVWPVGAQPLTTNAEIVRVTAISADTFTITRTQEGTTARAILIGDQIAATITVKTLTDIEQTASTSVFEQMMQVFDTNADPVDSLIQSGAYRIFIFYSSQNVAAWKTPTNARYAVPAGKKLLVVARGGAGLNDSNFRQARFRNVTDNTNVLEPTSFGGQVQVSYSSILADWAGDLANPSKLVEVPAGKTVEVEIWNADTSKRAIGVWVICREVAA